MSAPTARGRNPPRWTPTTRGRAAFWRSAQARYEALQTLEAGAADDATVQPMPPVIQAHVERLVALPAVRACYSTVPVAFGMVDLERLVISQYTLTGCIQKVVSCTIQHLGPRRTRREFLCAVLQCPNNVRHNDPSVRGFTHTLNDVSTTRTDKLVEFLTEQRPMEFTEFTTGYRRGSGG